MGGEGDEDVDDERSTSRRSPMSCRRQFSRLPSASASSYGGRISLFAFAMENEGIMMNVDGDGASSHSSRMEDEEGGSSSSSSSSLFFDMNLSTQENYKSNDDVFHGEFRDIRSMLDLEYHGNYRKARQEFQDKIVRKMLDGTTIRDDVNGSVCATPNEPWIVFTAGVMVSGAFIYLFRHPLHHFLYSFERRRSNFLGGTIFNGSI